MKKKLKKQKDLKKVTGGTQGAEYNPSQKRVDSEARLGINPDRLGPQKIS